MYSDTGLQRRLLVFFLRSLSFFCSATHWASAEDLRFPVPLW